VSTRSNVLRLAIFGLLVARAPRWVRSVLAWMALGVLLAVLVIIFAVSTRSEPAERFNEAGMDGEPVTFNEPVLACPDTYRECFEAFADIEKFQRLSMKKDLQALLQSAGIRRISDSDGPFIRLNRGFAFLSPHALCRVARVADYVEGESNPEKELWVQCRALRRKK
jgi:hypothetical protein